MLLLAITDDWPLRIKEQMPGVRYLIGVLLLVFPVEIFWAMTG